MKITRDVVTDLLPLYASGEASADTKALVDEFLRGDPEFARLVRENATGDVLSIAPPPLLPDHEMRTFTATRKAMHKVDWTLFFAMMFSCFAFGRIVSDTSWDVSPRNFAVTACIAIAFWIAFLVRFVRRMARLR